MNEETDGIDIPVMKQVLEARRDALRDMNESGAGARKPVTLDQSAVGRLSRMDAMQGQQMAAETARRRDGEIARIRAALKRIEDDEYGYCLRCEEEIQKKRLDSDPSATLCIKCASQRK